MSDILHYLKSLPILSVCLIGYLEGDFPSISAGLVVSLLPDVVSGTDRNPFYDIWDLTLLIFLADPKPPLKLLPLIRCRIWGSSPFYWNYRKRRKKFLLESIVWIIIVCIELGFICLTVDFYLKDIAPLPPCNGNVYFICFY